MRLPSSDREEFLSRLRIAIGAAGNPHALAKKAGISYAGLRTYLRGSEPTRPVLLAIADAAGVNRAWLVNGLRPVCDPGSPLRTRAHQLLGSLWEAACRSGASNAYGSVGAFREAIVNGSIEGAEQWLSAVLSDDDAPSGSASAGTGGMNPIESLTKLDIDGQRALGWLARALSGVVDEAQRQVDLNSDKLATIDTAVGASIAKILSRAVERGGVPEDVLRSVLVGQTFGIDPELGEALAAGAPKSREVSHQP